MTIAAALDRRNTLEKYAPIATTASTRRVFLAVDAANLFYTLQYGRRIRYDALLDYASNLGNCIQSAIYVSRDADSSKVMGLLTALRFMGYSRIVPRSHHVLSNGKKKSDIDVFLALDVWKSALMREMDTLVLATGDSDYVPLVERLVAEMGIAVHVIGPDWSTSSDLIIAASHFISASDVPGLVEEVPWLRFEGSSAAPATA